MRDLICYKNTKVAVVVGERLMDRETALKAIQENVKNENLIKHMLATEAIGRIKGQLLTLRD